MCDLKMKAMKSQEWKSRRKVFGAAQAIVRYIEYFIYLIYTYMHNLIEVIRSFKVFGVEHQQVLPRFILLLLLFLLIQQVLNLHVPGRICFRLFFLRFLLLLR
jgi:hypothetical protein